MYKILPSAALACILAISPALTFAEASTTEISMVRPSSLEMPVTRAEAVTYLYEHFQDDITRKNETVPALTFLDVPAESKLLNILGTLCVAQAISCSGGAFTPDQAVSLPALLKMYDIMVHHYTDAPLDSVPSEKRTSADWNNAYMQWGAQLGLVSSDTLMVPVSHTDIKAFFEKAEYLRSWNYALHTATPQLPVSLEEINDTQFTTLSQLDEMLALVTRAESMTNNRLRSPINTFRIPKDAVAHSRLRMIRMSLERLRTFMIAHPLYYDDSFSAEERAEFRKLGIKEIIGVGEYDFRNNAPYRKHNVRTTLRHVHKLILQPGEEFDYWKTMDAGGLDEVGNGWLIVEGKEVWGWGGGLCGTSTTIFRAAWFAGLEITERRPHTTYYTGLYGRNDMGLDAAVYQNSPNLRFVNNTGAPLMLYLRYNDTQDDAKLYVLGTKHFENFEFVKGARRGKVVNHRRVMTMKDGSVKEEQLYSAYRTVE